MYTSRVIGNNEKDRFDTFIDKHPRGDFMQLWEWGQVKKGTGWEPLALIVEEGAEIQAALLILKRKIPFLNRCVFYSPRGPVVDLENEKLCQVLFDGARRVAQDHGAIFLKIDPDILAKNDPVKTVLKNCGFRKNETGVNFEGVQPKYVFRLDISASEISLMENMHTKWRYNIRLAGKKGVKIRVAKDKEDLAIFYNILEETARRDKFLIRGYQYYEWIWEQMVQNNYGQIFLAEYDGQALAATLAMITGEKTWYLYGASSNQQRALMPNYLIQWEMIRWARERGCCLYDFRGVSGDLDENNPLYGLYRFKKGFGGVFTEFIGEWDTVYSPFYYFIWNRILPLYQQISRTIMKR